MVNKFELQPRPIFMTPPPPPPGRGPVAFLKASVLIDDVVYAEYFRVKVSAAELLTFAKLYVQYTRSNIDNT